MKLYLKHTTTGKKFEIVERIDGKVTLKGSHATFVEDWNPAKFKEMGYVLEKIDAEQQELRSGLQAGK